MNGHEARAFLEAILANPDDDTPRLVYADWLEEHGDGPRAEFIRVQVERARLPEWDGRQVSLRLRERALIEQHGAAWKAELPTVPGVEWGEFRRGFVGGATFASFASLRDNASACWAATPLEAMTVRWPRQGESVDGVVPIPGLRELSVTGQLIDRREVGRLADAPLMSTLRAVNLRNCSLGGDGFHRLLASPHLGNLKALRVPGNSIGNAAIRALFDAVSLKSLEELDLAETSSYGRTRRSGRYREDPVIEDTDLVGLASWTGLARLRSLTLSGNQARRDGLRVLLRSRHVTGLKELRLWSNGLTGQAMQEFGSARQGLQLDVLDLGENVLEDLGASDLAIAPCLSELKVLELDTCEIRLPGARWLANSPFVGSLRKLNVSNNTFGPEGLYRLLEKKPPFLHTLEIEDNDLGDEGVAHLAESRASDTLLEVDVSTNRFGDPGAKSLAKTRYLRNLLVLRMKSNQLGKPAATALAQSPLGKRLAVLDMGE